jgi:hypothetical protein
VAIKAKITFDKSDNLRRIEQAIIATLARRGEQFVTDARNNNSFDGAFEKGDYTDRTANLRNSIGYFILKDNDVIHSSFPGGQTQEAKAALNEVPKRPGYRLIGMAGMNYAAYVESRGYNVITSQSYEIVELLAKDLKELAKKTGKKMSLQ